MDLQGIWGNPQVAAAQGGCCGKHLFLVRSHLLTQAQQPCASHLPYILPLCSSPDNKHHLLFCFPSLTQPPYDPCKTPSLFRFLSHQYLCLLILISFEHFFFKQVDPPALSLHFPRLFPLLFLTTWLLFNSFPA